MNKIQKARSRLLFSQPFFASMLLGTPCIEDRTIPTAATDMRRILYNPDFIDGLDLDQVQGLLVHEVMHIAFEHGFRLHSRDHKIWNWACDYAINLLITDAMLKLPPDGLLDEVYRGMSADQIYEKLMQGAKKRKASGQGDPKDGIGQDLQAPGVSLEEAAVRQRQIKQQVAQAATMARVAGKLSGSLEAFVNAILNPVVPWQALLRDYMTRVSQDDETWSRRNRRFSDIYLPSRHSLRMGELVLIGDTSGSITQEELNGVAAEVNSIAETVRPERIRVLWADTEVKKEEVFEPGEPIDLHPMGRGGTDMRVPLEHVRQYDPQVVVLITDGHTPWPTCEPDYPLIVCCTTMVDVPVGLVVRV